MVTETAELVHGSITVLVITLLVSPETSSVETDRAETGVLLCCQ